LLAFPYPDRQAEKADACQCPIWRRGYLAKTTNIVQGKLRAKRIFASLDTDDSIAAEMEVARLYERGSLPPIESAGRQIDNSAITVRYAAERYLQSRQDGSLNPIEPNTYNHYASPIDQGVIPFCDEKGIVCIRDFGNKDVCSQFTESWRQLRRNTGELLAMTTRRTELEPFRTLLRECVENEWMAKNGAERIRFKNQKTAKDDERYGLEWEEYEQRMAAPDSAAQQNQETRAVTELMRWSRMRISDAPRSNPSTNQIIVSLSVPARAVTDSAASAWMLAGRLAGPSGLCREACVQPDGVWCKER
jgi:hypothetical protein